MGGEPGTSSPVEALSLEEISRLARGEVGRRLADPVLRDELPGTTLMQIVLLDAKQNEKAQEEARQRQEEKTELDNVDVLDVIEQSNLPPARRTGLLKEELARVDERRKRILGLLEAIDARS